MGKYDSSKTRVQPIFGQLLARDPSGSEWLSQLIACAPGKTELPHDVQRHPGPIVSFGDVLERRGERHRSDRRRRAPVGANGER